MFKPFKAKIVLALILSAIIFAVCKQQSTSEDHILNSKTEFQASRINTSDSAFLASLIQSAVNVIEVAKSGKPYDSIKPALAAASAGDLVIIYPGVYNDSNPTSFKNNVTMYYHFGSKMVNNRKSVQYLGTVLWDSAGPVQTKVYGHGVFLNENGVLGESFAIKLFRTGSNVTIEADSIFGKAMALESDSGTHLTVRCPYVMAYCEHGIRTRNGGFVELRGNLYSCDSCNDGGGQAVYFQGNSDTVIIRGKVYHEGNTGGIFSSTADTGVFILYGDLTSINNRAINMGAGKAYLYNSTVKTKGAIIAENLYASKSIFEQTGFLYFFGASLADTAYLNNCVGNSGIHPAAIWFGDYRQYGMGKIRRK